VLGQNLKAHMLLRDPLDSGRKRTEIFNIAGIGENGARERTRLRSGVAMMRLIEKVADFRVLEHPGIHFVYDVQTMRFQRGNGRLDERDRLIAKRLRHELLLLKCVEISVSARGRLIVEIDLHLH
jgi:hypothetical protein